MSQWRRSAITSSYIMFPIKFTSNVYVIQSNIQEDSFVGGANERYSYDIDIKQTMIAYSNQNSTSLIVIGI